MARGGRYYVLPEDQLSAVWEVNEAVLGALMDARVMFAVWPPGLGQSLERGIVPCDVNTKPAFKGLN